MSKEDILKPIKDRFKKEKVNMGVYIFKIILYILLILMVATAGFYLGSKMILNRTNQDFNKYQLEIIQKCPQLFKTEEQVKIWDINLSGGIG